MLHGNDLPEEFGISPGLADDEKFMLMAIGMDSFCIDWIGAGLFKNKEFIQMVLTAYEERWVESRNQTYDLEECDPFLQGEPSPYYANFIHKNIPDALRADPVIMLELIKRKLKITELHKTLSSNNDFLIKAVKYDANVFQLADNSLQNDVYFVRLAVKTNPTVWTLVSDEKKSNPEMQEALGDIKTYIYYDIDFCDGGELDRYCQLIPDEIRNDKEFAILLVTRNYHYLKYVSDILRDDLEVVESAYLGMDDFGFGEEELFEDVSPRIKSILEKSNLEPVETLTKAIESEKLHGRLGIALKVKDEKKLTPKQRKQQSGPVL